MHDEPKHQHAWLPLHKPPTHGKDLALLLMDGPCPDLVLSPRSLPPRSHPITRAFLFLTVTTQTSVNSLYIRSCPPFSGHRFCACDYRNACLPFLHSYHTHKRPRRPEGTDSVVRSTNVRVRSFQAFLFVPLTTRTCVVHGQAERVRQRVLRSYTSDRLALAAQRRGPSSSSL